MLSISGERKTEVKEGSEEEGNLRIERSYGSFARRFRLPDTVDVEGEQQQAPRYWLSEVPCVSGWRHHRLRLDAPAHGSHT